MAYFETGVLAITVVQNSEQQEDRTLFETFFVLILSRLY